MNRIGGVGAGLASRIGVLLVMAVAGSVGSSPLDPLIEPDVRVAIRAGTARVLVELRASTDDPSAIRSLQDEALRRLAGTGARLARRFSTVPLLALEIDAPALVRLESMGDIVTRVLADRITPPNEDQPRR
jgi:hypothetical protein